MESRQEQRLPIQLHVWLYLGNSMLTHGATHNVSRYGLFLHAAHPELARNMVVDVEVLDNIGQVSWYSRALVIHASSHGTGVFLEEKLPVTFFQPRKSYRTRRR
jgi:hypothetical protein